MAFVSGMTSNPSTPPGRVTSQPPPLASHSDIHGGSEETADALTRRNNDHANSNGGTSGSISTPNPVLKAERSGHRFFLEYKKSNALSDLEDALESHYLALETAESANKLRERHVSRVSDCLYLRYSDHSRDKDDLIEAISLRREALELRQPGPVRGVNLNILGSCLQERYNLMGDADDLTEAVQVKREALELHPPGHSERTRTLNGLAACLLSRYELSNNESDLFEAICLHREALAHLLPGDSGYHRIAINLAICLDYQHARTGDIRHLTEAASLHREALDLCPPGHPDHHNSLAHLARCLQVRYQVLGHKHDLFESIRLYDEALVLRPPGHPLRHIVLVQLALSMSHVISGVHPDDVDSISATISVLVSSIMDKLREATLFAADSATSRMYAAFHWRLISQRHGDLAAQLEATRATLNLLGQSNWDLMSLESLSNRFSEYPFFKTAHGVASDAAALAIQTKDVALAVTLLEQGRSSILNGLGRYRLAIDDVCGLSPELAERFVQLSGQLDALVVDSGSQGKVSTESFQDRATDHADHDDEWNTTVEDIRELPGFESFLLPSPFHHLQKAAAGGPVIIVNINERRSDAIIVVSSGDPVLVPLPDAYPEIVQRFINRLGKRQAECDARIAISILREIWWTIVAPIVTQLHSAPIQLPAKSRVWWYPVGAVSMLPLHAAGPYKRGEKNFAQLFVSSYTPSLGALVRARESRAAGPVTQIPTRSMLVIGQSDTPNERPLPNVDEEIHVIASLVPNASVLQSSNATKEAVLKGIQECNWLHLACHGHHHPKQPFQSHFSMHDVPISLLDLIAKDLPQAELAVLSACHSARVSEVLPDESLHPAAGMLFAGFKSVIGTMWAFDDGLGSPLASEFYKRMLDGKKDYTDAAVVLGDAFRAVMKRDPNAVPFMQYINVVHYGV